MFDELWNAYPTTTLTACGRAVGLPEGQMGNSEVGHLNLGAGSVVMQDLTRIDAAAEDGSLAANEVLREAFTASERVHVIGLVSDGGVHSSMEHLRALIEMAAELEVPDLVVHAFTDGRDTTPKSGAGYLDAGRRVDGGERSRPDRLGHRPLLRDGPRQALGPGPAGLRHARPRPRRASCRQRRAGRPGRL